MLVSTAFMFNVLYMFCTFNKQRLLFASDVGPRVMDYKYQPDAAHRCKRDVLLCRLKSSEDTTWKRIRPRPARNNFLGAFVLCKGNSLSCTSYNGAWFTFNTVMNVQKLWSPVELYEVADTFAPLFVEVQERQECQYGENCTFAYCQEEIDVWTQERKGALNRELLFDPLGTNERRALSVTRLLQIHMGMFMFLCEVVQHRTTEFFYTKG